MLLSELKITGEIVTVSLSFLICFIFTLMIK